MRTSNHRGKLARRDVDCMLLYSILVGHIYHIGLHVCGLQWCPPVLWEVFHNLKWTSLSEHTKCEVVTTKLVDTSSNCYL